KSCFPLNCNIIYQCPVIILISMYNIQNITKIIVFVKLTPRFNSVNRLIKLFKVGFSGIKVGGNSIDSDSVLKALANIHKNGIETNNPPIASNNAAKNFSVFFFFVCEAISRSEEHTSELQSRF